MISLETIAKGAFGSLGCALSCAAVDSTSLVCFRSAFPAPKKSIAHGSKGECALNAARMTQDAAPLIQGVGTMASTAQESRLVSGKGKPAGACPARSTLIDLLDQLPDLIQIVLRVRIFARRLLRRNPENFIARYANGLP